MTESELAWLAGLLEGEGSFLRGTPSQPNNIKVVLQMSDKDIVEKAAKLMSHAHTYNAGKPKEDHWRQMYHAKASGRRAAELMLELKPYMGKRRATQIDRALNGFINRGPGDNSRKLTREIVSSIRLELAGGASYAELGRKYGVSFVCIRKIALNRSWKQL
jgi:hypothetical protein